ncbi:MAG: DNA primase [bacterium]
MSFISQDITNKILERADIVDIISDVVTLTQVGKDYKGLCPFHSEKTPSFHVNQDKQVFYCFGCGKGGNIFTFMKEHYGLSFYEALRTLAQRYGVSFSYIKSKDREKDRSEHEKIKDINQSAAHCFHITLLRTQKAVEYLKSRGASQDTIQHFNLGYCNDSWDHLYNYLRKSYSTEYILKAGLIVKGKKEGSFYDRFRNRIIFPILNLYGEIIGFGGRCISDSNNMPKYLNSPETLLYKKGQNLFGLYHAHNDIRKKEAAILVEGYLDFFSVYQAGFKNVVATLGTALTPAQVSVLKRYTRHVYLIFDSDTAGQKAAKRGVELFLDAGIKIKIVVLPEGEDPNSLIQKEGPASFATYIEKAENFLDFLLSKQMNNAKEDDKIQITREIVPTLAKISDPLARDIYIRHLSVYSGIAEDSIIEAISRMRKQISNQSVSPREIINIKTNNCLEYKAQEMILRVALEHRSPCTQIIEHLNIADFSDPQFKTLAEIIFQIWGKGDNLEIDYIINQVQDDNLKELIATLLINDHDELGDTQKILSDCINVIENKKNQRNAQSIKEKIQDTNVGDEELDKLLMEYHRLKMQTCTINNFK